MAGSGTSRVVAIDGPAGAGKSTVARGLAVRLGFSLLDSGALYRALGLLARERGVALDDDAGLAAICAELGSDLRFLLVEGRSRVRVGDRDVSEAIRTPEVSDAASRVSARPAVRAALLGLLRALGRREGVVAEGRDMGTVVFPDAPVKFFLDARPEVRAARRAAELEAAGRPVDAAEVLRQQAERDTRDRERAAAPLRPAADAVLVDTTGLTVDGVIDRLEREARGRLR
jgi:cytidylate kinase